MNRRQLEHIIRAASTIAEDDELIIVGSQAILATHPDAPPELLVSTEADLYPKNLPERADLIDGSIGELSPFHRSFGYYAQGVDEIIALLAVTPIDAAHRSRLEMLVRADAQAVASG